MESTNLNVSGMSTVDTLEWKFSRFNSAYVESLTGNHLSFSGVSTFTDTLNTEDVLVNGSLSVPTGILSITNAEITNLTAVQIQFENVTSNILSAGTGIITSLSETNVEYTGVSTIANIQGKTINSTGISTLNEVGITTLTATTVGADNITVDSNLVILSGILTTNTFRGSNLDIDYGDISQLVGEFKLFWSRYIF